MIPSHSPRASLQALGTFDRWANWGARRLHHSPAGHRARPEGQSDSETEPSSLLLASPGSMPGRAAGGVANRFSMDVKRNVCSWLGERTCYLPGPVKVKTGLSALWRDTGTSSRGRRPCSPGVEAQWARAGMVAARGLCHPP